MLVGLGSGSTASYAIRKLGRCIQAGLRIEAVATSEASAALARSVGIVLVPLERVSRVDLTIDGVDQIDPMLNAIKGRGGALLREKIIASASDRVIVIADSSKCRSEEHTSELQSLMRISYAVFCLKKKN